MCIYCYFERGDDILLRRDQNVEPAYANIEEVQRVVSMLKRKAGQLEGADWREMMYATFAKERGARPTPRLPHPLRL